MLFNVRNDLCRFLIIERERLFHQQMTPGVDGADGQIQMGLRRSGNVHHIGTLAREHLFEVDVPIGNAKTNRQLLGHQPLDVADGNQRGNLELANLRDVLLRSLTAAHQCNLQSHRIPVARIPCKGQKAAEASAIIAPVTTSVSAEEYRQDSRLG